jgi:hypothetical protein
MLPRLLSLSLIFAVIVPAAGHTASYWPNSGLVEFNQDEFVEQSTPREIIDVAQAAANLPSPLAFTAVVHQFDWENVPSFFQSNSVAQDDKDTFLTAGHPGLINGFRMDERWGTSHASEEAKNYTSQKKSVEGDNVRFGQEDNSLYDGGADSVIDRWLTFWR